MIIVGDWERNIPYIVKNHSFVNNGGPNGTEEKKNNSISLQIVVKLIGKIEKSAGDFL